MLNPADNNIKWYDSFMKIDKFNWLNFEECFKKDGIYFYSINWDKSVEEIKKEAEFNLFGDCFGFRFFKSIYIKNHKCVRFGDNTAITDEDIENMKILYKNYRFAWICDE